MFVELRASFGTINAKYFYEHWVALKAILRREVFEKLTKDLCDDGEVEKFISEQAFDRSMCGLYRAVLRSSKNPGESSLIGPVAEGLRQVKVDEWKMAIGQQTPDEPMVALIKALSDLGLKLSGLNAYVMALSSYAVDIGTGKVVIDDGSALSSRWRTLRGILTNTEDAILQKELVEKGSQAGAALKAPFFEICLQDCGVQQIKELRTTLLSFFEKLVTGENDSGIVWMARIMTDYRKVIVRQRADAGQKFMVTAVQNALLRGEPWAERVNDALSTVASELGIRTSEAPV